MLRRPKTEDAIDARRNLRKREPGIAAKEIELPVASRLCEWVMNDA